MEGHEISDINKIDEEMSVNSGHEGVGEHPYEEVVTGDLQKLVVELEDKIVDLLDGDELDRKAFRKNERKLREIQEVLRNRKEESRVEAIKDLFKKEDEGDVDTFEDEHEEDAEVGEQEKSTDESFEDLKSKIAQKRSLLAKKQYKNNKLFAKMSKVAGFKEKDTEDEDLQFLKEDYYKAIDEYKNAVFEKVDSDFFDLPDEEKSLDLQRQMYRDAQKELYENTIQEVVYNLRDARQEERAKDLADNNFLNALNNVGKWMKKSRVAKGGAAFMAAAGLVMSGGIFSAMRRAPRVAMHVPGLKESKAVQMAATGAKFLTPFAVGVGTTKAAEWVQKKMFERSEKEKEEDFMKRSLERQQDFFMERNYNMLLKRSNKLDDIKKVSAAIGLSAAVLTGVAMGEIVSDDGAHEHAGYVINAHEHVGDSDNISENTRFVETEQVPINLAEIDGGLFDSVSHNFTDEMKETEAYHKFTERYGPEAHKNFLDKLKSEGLSDKEIAVKDRWWTRHVNNASRAYEAFAKNEIVKDMAKDFAERMGIDTSSGVNFETNGFVVTSINGHKVPEDFYTEKQLLALRSAKKIREWTPEDGTSVDGNVTERGDGTNNVSGVNEGVGTPWLGEEDDFYIKSELDSEDIQEFVDNKSELLAHKLASLMGVDSENIEFSTDFTVVNGVKVPDDILKSNSGLIKTIRSAMAGDKNALNKLKVHEF